jgi:hypothetical protein
MNEGTQMDIHETPESPRLTSEAARRGGQARAAKLTPERRREIASQAAEARWGVIPFAPNVGDIKIGDRLLSCAVLEDGTRLINQTTLLSSLGRGRAARKGADGERRAPFLAAANLQPFISDDLRAMDQPIRYRTPTGQRPFGYQADMLPLVCEVYADADAADVLTRMQIPVARAARLLYRGIARVGMAALVDEATGYQDVRARFELQAILAAYVQSELMPWVKRFPDDFFREIYRLHGWEYRPGTSKRTPYAGKLVNKYIYEQLPPGVLEQLQMVNPRTDRGHRARKHHQHLTADTGNPHLDKQISTVTTLMRISENLHQFETLFERAFPPIQPRLPLVIDLELPEAA